VSAQRAACLASTAKVHGAHMEAQRGGDFHATSQGVFETWGQGVSAGALPPPALILDVGANIGQSGVKFLTTFPPPLVVHSFELSQRTFGDLNRTMHAHNLSHRWVLHNLGVSSAPGSAAFSEPQPGPNGEVAHQTATLGEHTQLRLAHASVTARITTVALILEELQAGGQLAAAGGEVHLLKIDVEGYEGDVLLGAQLEVNARRIRAIFFEWASTWSDSRAGPATLPILELKGRLDAVGFECFIAGDADLASFGHPLPDVQGYGPNVLCLRRDTEEARYLLTQHRKHLTHCPWWE
jgi:FkbM family methyltransferase